MSAPISSVVQSDDKLLADVKRLVADVEALIPLTAGHADAMVLELRMRLEYRLKTIRPKLIDADALAPDKTMAAFRIAASMAWDAATANGAPEPGVGDDNKPLLQNSVAVHAS